MRAAIYARISHDATGESLGVSRQQEDCREVAQQAGWDVVEVYADNDISATSGKPRPAYQRMLADIEAGSVEAIVAWHPDRLLRTLKDLEHLIDLCEKHSVAIRTCRAGEVDLSSPTGRMLARIVAAVAKSEVEVKADRWSRSFRQAREQGRFPQYGAHRKTGAGRMFGWDREGKVIPEEAATIVWMADELLSGKSIHGICRELGERGVKTTRGLAWQPASVRYLLKNPRLVGDSTIKGEVVGEGAWQPILGREVFELVQAILMARSRRTNVRVSLLPGLVACGVCDSRLRTGQDGGRRTYICKRSPGDPTACGGVTVLAEPVEQLVEAYAREMLSDSKVRRRLATLTAGAGAPMRELAAMEARLREIEDALESDPGRSVGALLRAADRVRERIEMLQGQLVQHAAVPVPGERDHWPTDLQRRRSLVELVVARVLVDPSPARGGRFVPERVRIEPA